MLNGAFQGAGCFDDTALGFGVGCFDEAFGVGVGRFAGAAFTVGVGEGEAEGDDDQAAFSAKYVTHNVRAARIIKTTPISTLRAPDLSLAVFSTATLIASSLPSTSAALNTNGGGEALAESSPGGSSAAAVLLGLGRFPLQMK